MTVKKQRFGDNLKISIKSESATDKMEVAASMDVKHNLSILSTTNPSSLSSDSAAKISGGLQVQKDIRSKNLFADSITSDLVKAKSLISDGIKIGDTDRDISSISIKNLSSDNLSVLNINSSVTTCGTSTAFKSSEYIDREKFFASSNLNPSKDIFLKSSLAPSNDILLGSQDSNYIGSDSAIDLFEFNTHGIYSSGRETGYFIKNNLNSYGKLSLIYDISNFNYINPESSLFSSISIPFAYYSDTNTDHKSKILLEYAGYRISDNKNYGTYLYRKCFDVNFDINSTSIMYDSVNMNLTENNINLSRTDVLTPLSSNIAHTLKIKLYIVPNSEIYIRGFSIKYKTKNIQDKS